MKIKLYGADWCSACFRAKYFFKENTIQYEYSDIDHDLEASVFVMNVNSYCFRSIPVIEVDDGTIMIEPNYRELVEKFLK